MLYYCTSLRLSLFPVGTRPFLSRGESSFMLYPAQDPAPPWPLVVRQSPPAELYFFLSLFLAWHIVRFAVHRGLICSDMRSVIHSHEGHWRWRHRDGASRTRPCAHVIRTRPVPFPTARCRWRLSNFCYCYRDMASVPITGHNDRVSDKSGA